MRGCRAGEAAAARVLASVHGREVCAYADEEHIEAEECVQVIIQRVRLQEKIVDDRVVADCRECGDRSVHTNQHAATNVPKTYLRDAFAVEIDRHHVQASGARCPVWRIQAAIGRRHAVAKLIKGEVEPRLTAYDLDRSRKSRLARTRGAIEKNDAARIHGQPRMERAATLCRGRAVIKQEAETKEAGRCRPPRS